MAIPKMEMNPIAADTEKFIPVIIKARTPPVHATGIEMMTISVSTQLPTAMYTTNPMSRMVSGTINVSRCMMLLSSWISPYHSRCMPYGIFTSLLILACASSMAPARSLPRTLNLTGA